MELLCCKYQKQGKKWKDTFFALAQVMLLQAQQLCLDILQVSTEKNSTICSLRSVRISAPWLRLLGLISSLLLLAQKLCEASVVAVGGLLLTRKGNAAGQESGSQAKSVLRGEPAARWGTLVVMTSYTF